MEEPPKQMSLKKPGFVNRNLVWIVMIPGLVLMHLGWLSLQNTPAAKTNLPDNQLNETPQLPIIKIAAKLKAKYFGNPAGSKD